MVRPETDLCRTQSNVRLRNKFASARCPGRGFGARWHPRGACIAKPILLQRITKPELFLHERAALRTAFWISSLAIRPQVVLQLRIAVGSHVLYIASIASQSEYAAAFKAIMHCLHCPAYLGDAS